MVLLEVCIDSQAALDAAVSGGAHRLEVCARLDVGGLTPEDALLAESIATGVPCVAMLRARAGDFVYTAAEMSAMLAQLARLKVLSPQGVVFGALTASGDVDRDAVSRVIALARPMSVTFHRAFDAARDPFAALDDLIGLGVDRVLTSGGAQDAFAGRDRLRDLVAHARGRITILAGGGVRAHNAREIVRASGVGEIHSSTVFAPP
jgi:copper homeostasis protein